MSVNQNLNKLYFSERRIDSLNLIRLSCLTFILFFFCIFTAQGDNLSEYRVLFEDRDRGQEIRLTNSADTPKLFSISLVELSYLERGGVRNVDAADADWPIASPMLRLAPRRPIVLAPRETQRIRIALRKPAGLTAGEYRSHLRVLSSDVEDSNAQRSGLHFDTKVSMSIPVIVRHGVRGSSVSLTGLSVNPVGQALEVGAVLEKELPKVSAFGLVEVRSPHDGKALGDPAGVSLPMEIQSSTFTITLDTPSSTWPAEAELVYIDADRKTETVLTRFALTR